MENTPPSMEEKILEAAETLFMEKGFAMTSTTEIAKVAGCNQALVHYYYRTKDRLFEAIFIKKATLFISTILEISDRNDSFQQKLTKKIEAHYDMLVKNQHLPFLLLNEFNTNPKRIHSIKEQLQEGPKKAFKAFNEELTKEIAAGKVRPIEAMDLIFTILSLNLSSFLLKPVFQLVSGKTDSEYTTYLEKRKKEIVRIILNSIKPD